MKIATLMSCIYFTKASFVLCVLGFLYSGHRKQFHCGRALFTTRIHDELDFLRVIPLEVLACIFFLSLLCAVSNPQELKSKTKGNLNIRLHF
jgi:hypothetical protein